MQVFKACLRILKKNLVSMSIYLGIFLVFVVLVTSWNPQAESVDFTMSRPRMAIINEDSGQPVSDGLIGFLAEHAQITDIGSTENEQKDALFFRRVVYILKIPSGFSSDLISGNNTLRLSRTSVPDSYQAAYSDQLVESYLSGIDRYLTADPLNDINQVLTNVERDLGQSSKVTVRQAENSGGFNPLFYYFTFAAYALMAVMILGVTSLMLAFSQIDIRRRNLCAPVKALSFNLQQLLGNAVFAITVWTALSLVSLYFKSPQTDYTVWLLLLLNTLVFIMTCLSLSFLISQFIKSNNVQQAIANVLSLGTCFLSGVFVPQEMLGEKVLAFASFTPTYWYVRAIRILQHSSSIKLLEMNSFTQSLLIQIAFAIAFFTVSLVVARQKRQDN